MKTKNILTALGLIVILSSCTKNTDTITHVDDYNSYLENTENEMLRLAEEDFNFWEKKLEKEPYQFPYLAKAAASQSLLFNKTGNIEALIKAEHYLIEANEKTNDTKVGYLRALARNYVSQHKFKEALTQLKKAEAISETLQATQKMLFDVHLELGNYDLAKDYLETFRNDSDFDYLIRLSKWSDHRGNLDATIKYMEQAKKIAESSNLSGMKQWTYTNLADYYGHAGNIKASYNHYLKALELAPDDAYAKKGIAWIVYSYEKNPDEALRILNKTTQRYNAPDYYLLKAEIAEYKGDMEMKNQQLKLYNDAVKNPHYGNMYNVYNAKLYVEDEQNSDLALTIAQTEIANRPTPQSYDLLAWTYFNRGDIYEALQVMENYVVNKTYEPETLYHLAEVYKANGNVNKAKELKQELLESTFELGPLMEEKIKDI